MSHYCAGIGRLVKVKQTPIFIAYFSFSLFFEGGGGWWSFYQVSMKILI